MKELQLLHKADFIRIPQRKPQLVAGRSKSK